MRKKELKLIKQARFCFSRGVSFTEVLISFFIITVALVTFLSLASTQLRILKSAEERLLANVLALEGIELVQAYRNKQINQENWLGDLSEKGEYCIHFDNNFYIRRLQDCPEEGRLYLSNNRFLHLGGERTSFKRVIEISDALDLGINDLSNSNFVKVIATVVFREGEIKLETILTKWHPLFP